MPDVTSLSLLRQLPGAFLALEPCEPYRIVEASGEYLQVSGVTRDQLVGRPLFEVFPDNPDASGSRAVSHLDASLRAVLADGGIHELPRIRYDVRNASGQFETRWWRALNAPILGADGRVALLLHRVDEITETVRMEGERKRFVRDLHATEVLESITEGFFALDAEYRFTYVNAEARRILSEEGDLLGRVIWDVYPGLFESEFGTAYRAAVEEGRSGALTAFYPGHQRWYEVHVYPLPTGVAIYFRNVTAQRQLEADREEFARESDRQRRIYEAVLSSTPDLVYIFDLQHRFIYANEALLRMWGRTAAEAVGRNCRELGYEEWHAAMHDREIERVIETRAPVQGEVPFEGATGRHYWDYIFVPVIGADGGVVAIAGTSRDTTGRREAEEEIAAQAKRLLEVDRAKDEFIATLSHELRNPLAPLRNSVALMRMAGGSTDPRFARLGETMERQVGHLVRLVDDLLEISRVSRGDFVLQVERTRLQAIVGSAVDSCAQAVESRRHQLRLVQAPGELWVEADPVRLSQVIANLVDNAAKYTPNGGTIDVLVEGGEDVATVRVRDNGTGISPERHEDVFRMFSRGERTGMRGEGGLGIGLALARRLAAMHRGTLAVASEGIGHGSEFTLTIPLVAAPAREPGEDPVVPQAMLRKKILVVDDNRDAAETLGMVLEQMGAEVRVAYDGLEAVSAFSEYDAAAVLLDIGMPYMDGYEVARTLRSQYPDRRPRLIAITGWGQEKDRMRAKDAGFDHHITKPADLGLLQEILASI